MDGFTSVGLIGLGTQRGVPSLPNHFEIAAIAAIAGVGNLTLQAFKVARQVNAVADLGWGEGAR